ncbi:MAG: hypothetical protein Q4C53_06550 [Clostridia bacterium]|nr:hypothetical protein [Clostridia bacterium]
MRKTKLFAAVFALLTAFAASAAAEPKEIATREQLEAVRLAPEGAYVLTADIDLAGAPWEPLVLSGSFDGNGHTVSNIELTATNAPVRTTKDGNKKEYKTACIGFFGALDGAAVKDLTLANVTADIRGTENAFLGGLAGWMDAASVEGCSVTGTLRLVSSGKIAGIAGIAGYGDGKIANCVAEVSLSIGDDAETTPTEQFLGGVLACGHADISGCTVRLDALSAVWGYCHDGGLVGMFAVLKKDGFRRYRVTDCTVEATIRFFEKGPARRAYCKPFLGEQLHEKVSVSHNKKTFLKEEMKEYPQELR